MYVELIRIRHKKDTFLIGDYNRAATKVKDLAENEYLRFRKESQIETLPATQINEDTLTIMLLNT